MASNDFDYRKIRTQIEQLLPPYFRTDFSTSIFSNGADRFLTPDDTVYVNGTVGKKNTNVKQDNRIIEETIHRQAWQLQPLLYSKLATVDYIYSYKDILNKLELLGVDTNRLPLWGDTKLFNYVPPIDIDKLINYQDYFWVENSKPQYITIKNPASVIRSRIVEKTKHYNDLVVANAPAADLQALQLEIQALFAQEQTILDGASGWSTTLWDDNVGDWDINNLWLPYGVEPTGQNNWDAENSFDQNPWIVQNKWVHKSDLSSTSHATRATLPIIEYNSNLELNEWVYIKHNWKYRATTADAWKSVDIEPSLLEIKGFFNVINIAMDDTLSATPEHKLVYVIEHNVVDSLPVGIQFAINHTLCNDGTWTVAKTEYLADSDTTLIYTTDVISYETPAATIFDDVLYGFDVNAPTEYLTVCPDLTITPTGYAILTPVVTGMGDAWAALYLHWKWDGVSDPITVNHQPSNPAQHSYVEIVQTATQSLFTLPFYYYMGGDGLRVYVNGIRQYFNYTEVLFGGVTSNAIQFTTPLVQGSYVQIYAGTASVQDAGREFAWVRTSELESLDINDIVDFICLVRYRKYEQVKTEINQYPLFDLYNVDGTPANKANSIFKFIENSDYPVDPRVNKRIEVLNSGKEYNFEQLLVDPTTNVMYCYKDYDTVSVDNPSGLQTIWRSGVVDDTYVPRYVNEYRLEDGDSYIDRDGVQQIASVPVGSTTGDWEIADQLYYNPEHENRVKVSYTQLYTHFTTIINKQTQPVGYEFVPSTSTFKLLDSVNYSLGGTIREHNGSYDNFLSAIYQDIITPTGLLDFANTQYENCILLIKDLYVKAGPAILSNTSTNAIADPSAYLIEQMISLYKQNVSQSNIYGDSTAYDSVNNIGVPNWIATLPVLNILPKTKPRFIRDTALGVNKLVHHDGHMTDLSMNQSDLDTIITSLISINGARGAAGYPNIVGLAQGYYWYNASTKVLWRYSPVYIGEFAPNIPTQSNLYWYNNITNVLYVQDAVAVSGWAVEPDHTKVWTQIDLLEKYSQMLLAIEQRLYDVAPDNTTRKLDLATVITSTDDAVLFYDKLNEQFVDYTKQIQFDAYATDYDITNPFTWNYRDISSTSVQWPNANQTWGARWYTIYEAAFNTAYPHLEPWKLQGYLDKPDWWDAEYVDISNQRTWLGVMWSNIKGGIIPAGKTLPTVTVPTYTHVCVNTTSTTIDGYLPDGLLPPYYSGNIALEQEVFLRGSLVNISTLLPLISLSYNFGDQGPVERIWRESSNYRYSIVKAAFLLQPIRVFTQLFGYEYYNINGLEIEKTKKYVISHADAFFHGDVTDAGRATVAGTNQWYINALRYKEYDNNTSDFINMWTGWSPKLAYQFNSAINSRTLNVSTKFYPLSDIDYNLYLKKVPALDSYWVSALLVTVQTVGTVSPLTTTLKLPAGAGDDWVYRIDTPANVGIPFKFFDVNSFFITHIDDITNEITIDRAAPWETGREIQLESNINHILADSPYYAIKISDTKFKLASSYTAAIALYNDVNTYDTIAVLKTVDETTPPIDYNVGDIWMYTDSNSHNVVLRQYSIANADWIAYSFTQNLFKLPYSCLPADVKIYNNAILLTQGTDYLVHNDWVEILIPNILTADLDIRLLLTNDINIYEQYGLFQALSGANTPLTWRHYVVNTDRVNTLHGPLSITGIQNVINFIDGYADYSKSIGFVFNDFSHTDVDDQTGLIISWQTEIEKMIDKFYRGFNNVYDSSTSTYTTVYDYHEVNPFKYNIWLRPTRGMLSNIITGPFIDIKIQPIVFNQDGLPIQSIENLKIYRTDKQTHILYPHTTDGSITSHISGMHLYTDTYEHVIIFNDYTVDDNLVYDPFLGLNVSKIHLDFKKHYEVSGRPNLGGQVLLDNTLIDNMESTTRTFRDFYDTHIIDENAKHIDYIRALLDYQPNSLPYLTDVGINEKSKFLFWRGMIQHKGSNHAVQAFTNSRIFESILIDEFWAYKLAEFGDVGVRWKPMLSILETDVVRDTVKYHFTTANDPVDADFVEITSSDKVRWVELPNSSYITADNMFFDVNTKKVNNPVINVFNTHQYTTLPEPADGCTVLFDNNALYKDTFNTTGVDPIVTLTQSYVLSTESLIVYVNGIMYSDITELTSTTIQINNIIDPSVVVVIFKAGTLQLDVHFTQVNATTIKWNIDPTTLLSFALYYYTPNTKHIAGSKIIDSITGIEIAELPLWNPAQGIHDINVDLNVDIFTNQDPAIYSIDAQDNISNTFDHWGAKEKGRVWVDNSKLTYIPYYDNKLFDSIHSRLFNWGKQATHSSVDVYEWVETSLIPNDWVAAATAQQTTLIDEKDKITGVPYTTYYYTTRPDVDTDWVDWLEITDQHLIVPAYKFITAPSNIIVDVQTGNVDYEGHTSLAINSLEDTYGVYVNELKLPSNKYTVTVVADIVTQIEVLAVTPADTIRIVKVAHIPSQQEIDTLNADDTALLNYKQVYPYNSIIEYDTSGEHAIFKHYYWVKNRTNKIYPNNISLSDIKNLISRVDTPYAVVQKLLPAGNNLPARYTQFIMRNIQSYINDGARYHVLLQRDATLRDELSADSIIPKNVHSEWKLFREQQLEVVPREMWDKITETLTGVKLTDPTLLIPSVDRVLFDSINGTTTQYGLGVDQAVGDQAIVLTSLLEKLSDSSFDIRPINKEKLLTDFPFNSNSNIIEAMDFIYNSFNSDDVNAIFFGVLRDLLTYTHKLDGVFKTSMVSVRSSSKLQTARDVIDD